MHPESKKVWLVAASMGYGHLRAAVPLLAIAKEGSIITANDYTGIPEEDKKTWRSSERFYNLVSRMKGKGWLGDLAFNAFDILQRISPFYPAKAEHQPTFQLRVAYHSVKNGLGRHLMEKLMLDPAPIVTTFFTVGHIADYWNYPEQVYVVVTDSDISRVWGTWEPEQSKLIYFASSKRSAERLLRYGVPKEHVVLTGFPLPEELIGPRDKIAKDNLRRRISRLDPQGVYRAAAGGMVRQHLGTIEQPKRKEAPEMIFAVGGAGAQLEIAKKAIPSLAKMLKQKKLVLHLVAGVSKDAADQFDRILRKADLQKELGGSVRLHLWDSKTDYFKHFQDLLQRCDIVWTKPSELSFYAALGIPLLLTEPVGSQEVMNREWLLDFGAAVDMPPAEALGEWLPDMIARGRFAEMAMNGFAKMERHGAANIKEYLKKGKA